MFLAAHEAYLVEIATNLYFAAAGMDAVPGVNSYQAPQAKENAMKVGVVGLGSLGYGIAASLLRAGH